MTNLWKRVNVPAGIAGLACFVVVSLLAYGAYTVEKARADGGCTQTDHGNGVYYFECMENGDGRQFARTLSDFRLKHDVGQVIPHMPKGWTSGYHVITK